MRPRLTDFLLGSVAGLLAALAVWLSATGTEQFSMYIVSAAVGLIVLLLGSVWCGWQKVLGRPAYPVALGAIAILALLVSVSVKQWPLRITYSVSRSAFNATAQRVREGQKMTFPQRIGLFTIRKAEVSHTGVVCLWTRPAASGNTGFVQCNRESAPVSFNLWSMVKLDDGWQFISED